jgi:hypothetical protein
MKYILPDFDLTPFPQVYVGQRSRYATATAVSFVNETTILVASFLDKKIYLIDLPSLTILNQLSLTYYPDMMDYKDGTIITSNRPDGERFGCITICKLVNNDLQLTKEIKTDLRQTHGCRILNENKIVVTNTDDFKRGIHFFNIQNETSTFFAKFKFFPKDVFLVEDKILIVTSNSRPNALNKVRITDFIIYLFHYPSFRKLDEKQFYGQTDCFAMSGEHGFITLQGQDSLLHFTLVNNKINIIGEIGGFNFPHGIAALNDTVIVTNYGDNSIDILQLNGLIT